MEIKIEDNSDLFKRIKKFNERNKDLCISITIGKKENKLISSGPKNIKKIVPVSYKRHRIQAGPYCKWSAERISQYNKEVDILNEKFQNSYIEEYVKDVAKFDAKWKK